MDAVFGGATEPREGLQEAPSFGDFHFGAAQLGDKRLTARAVLTPLEWILLSNVPTTTQAQAWERVDWYECRPVIEECHKAMKTGCGMEHAQFTTRKALEALIAMISVVSVQLLRLRDLSRRPDADTIPATEVIDACSVEAITLWRYKRVDLNISVKEFLRALAYKGGHLNRTHDRPPGWLVLWRGWMELQPIVEG